MFRNTAFPNLGVAAFCKCWHMGFMCFIGCPRRDSHILPLVLMIDKVATEMATSWGPMPAVDGNNIKTRILGKLAMRG